MLPRTNLITNVLAASPKLPTLNWTRRQRHQRLRLELEPPTAAATFLVRRCYSSKDSFLCGLASSSSSLSYLTSSRPSHFTSSNVSNSSGCNSFVANNKNPLGSWDYSTFVAAILAATATMTATGSCIVLSTDDSTRKGDWTNRFTIHGNSASSVTSCEAVAVNHDDSNDDDDDDDKEEDPYDNLPDEDEPTQCSICLTYRQGPCRPYWRKVEACTKDNEFKDNGKEDNDNDNKNETTTTSDQGNEDDEKEPPCLKYMLPWIECATGYRNLYALIELDTNYTMGIADLEKEATVQACWALSSEPDVDWSAWETYLAQHPSWKPPAKSKKAKHVDRIKSKGSSERVPLWKTLGSRDDPEVVEITASVAATHGIGVLECTYALDQAGNVLGFTYGTKPSEVAKQTSVSDEDTAKSDPAAPAENVDLKIRLLPSHTRTVTIAAAYTQPPADGTTTTTTDSMESHIFKSRPFSLKAVKGKLKN